MRSAIVTRFYPAFLLACSQSPAPADSGADVTIDVVRDSAPAPDAVVDAADITDAIDAPTCPAASPSDLSGSTPLSVVGDTGSANGIFDPSIVYPASATAGFMTYSSVPSAGAIHTRISASNDHGATWTYFSDVNTSSPMTVTTTDTTICGAATCTGTRVHETSSLVVDPDDPDLTREFKVFTHSYLYTTTTVYQIGVISMYTAASPMGPWTETPLLGWNSSSPQSSTGVVQNVNTDPMLSTGLAACYLVSEPGAMLRATASGDVIDLVVGCLEIGAGGSTPIEEKLIRSTDHAHTFQFVSTLLSAADATALGAVHAQMNAADLFSVGGVYYLYASPDGPVNVGTSTFDGYRGCLAFAFADIDAGQLVRCDGTPVVSAAWLGRTGQFLGACTADEGASANGVVVPIANLGMTPTFTLTSTHHAAP